MYHHDHDQLTGSTTLWTDCDCSAFNHTIEPINHALDLCGRHLDPTKVHGVIDSTMRSNATVGPPLECLFYRRGSLEPQERYFKLEENHPYLAQLRQSWDDNIRSAFEELPSLSAMFEGDG